LSRRSANQFDYVIADVNADNLNTVLARVQQEPIDILSGLPSVPKERATDLISALAANKVALELNSVHRTPGRELILQAKEAGCKFAFGTANASAAELKRCEYGLQMVEDCRLDWRHFFTPGGWSPKAVDRRWS
jgi:histidinol phosphatase-like PHP family hydrolase